MTFTLFASGSTGNCSLISSGATHILVDAGISARRIKERLAPLGLAVGDLTAAVVTHPHADHISGLETLIKNSGFPIYATAPVARQLCYRLPIDPRVHIFQPEDTFGIGDVTVRPIPTSHDTPGSVGYRFTGPEGRTVCIVTDLGVVTDPVRDGVTGADVAVIECNHDLQLLREGPYPYHLQQRIAGAQGHLCNEDGASLCALAAKTAHTLVLAHLSQQNNTPRLALAAVRAALGDSPAEVAVAPPLCGGLTWEV